MTLDGIILLGQFEHEKLNLPYHEDVKESKNITWTRKIQL